MAQARCSSTRNLLGAIIHCRLFINHFGNHQNGRYEWSPISLGILNPDLTPTFPTEQEKQMASRGMINPEGRPNFEARDVAKTALDAKEQEMLPLGPYEQGRLIDEMTLKQVREINTHIDKELSLLNNKKSALLALKYTIKEKFNGN